MLTRDEIISNLKFYKWSDKGKSIKDETPIEYDIDDFFEDIRKDPPYNDGMPVYVINNTINGKTSDDFLCSNRVFIDIDFHYDDEDEKINELKRFYQDTKTKSLQDFVDIMKSDPHCMSAGLSKSVLGLRMFFTVITSYYEESLLYDLDYPTDWNKQIHKSNWNYVMDYLSVNYGINRDRIYAGGKVGDKEGDCTASRLHQVTNRYRRTGSFYNENWEPMYNKHCEIITENKYHSIPDEKESFEVKFLDDLYNQNRDKFKSIFEHYNTFDSLFYVLRTQPDDIINWFYKMIDECYSPSGGLRPDLVSYDKFYKMVKSKTTGTDLPLKAFLFKRGIVYTDPLKFEDDDLSNTINDDDEEDDFIVYDGSSLPTIPEQVYESCPNLLKEMCGHFKKGGERDIFLLSELVVLSVLFPKYKTLYWGKEMYSNIYGFVDAPSATGKDVVTSALKTLNSIKDDEKQLHQRKVQDWILNGEKGTQPMFHSIKIPGNASKAGIMNELLHNNGVGLIFETEADVITNNKKQDWGLSSSDYRDAFGHGPMSDLRKIERHDVDKTNISVFVSGTHTQVRTFIGEQGTEDGLFSRFFYYYWSPILNWEDGNGDVNFDNIFGKKFAVEVKKFYDNYKLKEIEFKITEEQRIKMFKHFDRQFNEGVTFIGDGFAGPMKRLAVIAKRIMMIMSILRHYDDPTNTDLDVPDGIDIHNIIKKPFEPVIICQDVDFNNVMSIISVLYEHIKFIYTDINRGKDVSFHEDPKTKIFRSLPVQFKKSDMWDEFKNSGLTKSTFERFIHSLKTRNWIQKIDRSTFLKTNLGENKDFEF